MDQKQVSKAILDALSELYEYRISELAPFIQPISQTKKFKKRIGKLLSFLLKINNLVSHKKEKNKIEETYGLHSTKTPTFSP